MLEKWRLEYPFICLQATPQFFRSLAKVNPRSEIPTIATVVSGVPSALFAFIFNLHDLVEMMSIGTLLVYAIVAGCMMVLRYRPETSAFVRQNDLEEGAEGQRESKKLETKENSPLLRILPTQQASCKTASGSPVVIIMSSFGMVALSALITWGSDYLYLVKWWAVLLLAVIIFYLIGCTFLRLWLPQNKTPLPFMVPFVPVLPVVSVFINVFLMLKLYYLTWLRFAVWMVIGKSTIRCTWYYTMGLSHWGSS